MEFRWITWNVEHIGEHGISPAEAEFVVENALRPYPRREADQKWIVRGQTRAGEYIQVVYVFGDDGFAFVIHARPLNDREKRALRRHRK